MSENEVPEPTIESLTAEIDRLHVLLAETSANLAHERVKQLTVDQLREVLLGTRPDRAVGQHIALIRLVKQLTGCGLREAKDLAVELQSRVEV